MATPDALKSAKLIPMVVPCQRHATTGIMHSNAIQIFCQIVNMGNVR